ncbi:MAG: nitroreductase family deazaflavin-dependent oxidoreductase [Chloroflexi bacterium]|nr:MAG: nitroreductase family deazaflavin-dependent oxidoreductase [Chloroflexota bacterium]MBL1196576.1 nitroreductase family deazaflavin-dependent oxidoreductase [Chloroflexota bacterium]NOH13871.1 nitroreductase family deazaflavin-dependent oxidoreductase [Chloroflexota bacterium]
MTARTRTPFVKALWRMHRFIYQASGGRLWNRIVGMPVLVLHTVGNKTGNQHSNTLSYISRGDDFIIAASNGGADTPPDWYRNLQAEPNVQVQVGREMIGVVAREAEGEERDALWAQFKQAYEGYGRYEQRTERVIAVIVLERAQADRD